MTQHNTDTDAIEKFASGQTPLNNEAIFITGVPTKVTENNVAITLNDVLEGSPQHKEILALIHEKLHEDALEITNEIDQNNQLTR